MERSDRRALGAATAILGLVLAIVTFTGPRGLLGGDEGVKLIQAFGVLEYGLGDPQLPYPARAFDPTESRHPVVAPHVVTHHGKRYGIYPITFTAPSAVAWRLGGFWALHVLPLVGGILAVAMTMALARAVTGDTRWAITAGVLVVITTPVSVYAGLFNEHAPGAGAFIAGLWGLATARRRHGLALAGVALGLAATLRGELIAAAPAVIVFALCFHGARRDTLVRLGWVTLGAATVMAGFLLYNVATAGILLPGVTANRAANRPRGLWSMLPLLYGRKRAVGVVPLAVLLAGVGFAVIALWRRLRSAMAWRATALLGAVWFGITVWLLARVTPGVGPQRTAAGLFVATPMAILAVGVVAMAPGDERRRALACVAAAILGTAAIFCTNADGQAGGLQFGARHLLALTPLYVIGVVAAVRRAPRPTRIVAAGLIAAGAWATVVNLRAWHHVAGETAALTTAAARSPSQDLVSSFFWGPEIIAPLWQTRRVSLANDEAELIDRLEVAGVTEITQVLGGLEGLERQGRLVRLETLDARRGVIRYRIAVAPR